MRIPTATYRLQFNRNFGFSEASDIIGYLSDLNISDLYASPVFKARKGSQHGYDIVNPNRLNPELGSQQTFDTLRTDMAEAGMGWIQDIVPNHMAFDAGNRLLRDILEYGRESSCANVFDINWEHPDPALRQRLMAPFLGSEYDDALVNGQIRLDFNADGFSIHYFNHVFPLYSNSYTHIIKPILNEFRSSSITDPTTLALLETVKSHIRSTRQNAFRPSGLKLKSVLRDLYRAAPNFRQALDAYIARINGKKGQSDSFSELDRLLSRQIFYLCNWKQAARAVNYRRFFNINELICLNTQSREVFDLTHKLVLKHTNDGTFSGLRIDHIDGLWDPHQYLSRLRDAVCNTWIVVEKILQSTEETPDAWPVQGTTGYDFLHYVTAIFCRTDHEEKFNRLYTRFTKNRTSWHERVHRKKLQILESIMAGDIDNLSVILSRILSESKRLKSVCPKRLTAALAETAACFPVYRTYITEQAGSQFDRLYMDAALQKAAQHRPELQAELEGIRSVFAAAVLDPDQDTGINDIQTAAADFFMKFQQFTAPVTAKGLEDSALFVYNRLLSLNDVGADPGRFGCHAHAFHAFLHQRSVSQPLTMNATATHDTKRGEDVRARLNVLSELPGPWEQAIHAWAGINNRFKTIIDGVPVPDANEEYYIYQTLLGAMPPDESLHPDFIVRVKAHMVKALREAREHSSWMEPAPGYETACSKFIDNILNKSNHTFMQSFKVFLNKIAFYGIFNSLSQVLIKITAPGIPDFYQGTELWDLNLTDPDNRRPVDFTIRKTILEDIRQKNGSDRHALLKELLRNKKKGNIKCFLIWKALKIRNQHQDLFQNGRYLALFGRGRYSRHIIAFARIFENHWCITVVPRFLTSLIEEDREPMGREVWQDTELSLPDGAPERFYNVLTSEEILTTGKIMIGDVLNRFPVALLVGVQRTEQ